jgi:SAM-dependent methyltransferase
MGSKFEAEETMARKHAASYFEPPLRRLHEAKNEHILSHLSGPRAVLDIGCGVGTLLLSLDDTDDYVGVDASLTAIEALRDRFDRPGLLCDTHALPFPDDTFDVVVLRSVLHHFRDVPTALSEVRRVLTADGRVVVFEGATDSRYRATVQWVADIVGVENEVSAFDHLTIREIEVLLDDAGFDIAASESVGGASVPLSYLLPVPAGVQDLLFGIDDRYSELFHWYNLVCAELS